jgi:hypothetical protein
MPVPTRIGKSLTRVLGELQQETKAQMVMQGATMPERDIAPVMLNPIDYEHLAGVLTYRLVVEIDDPVDPYRIDYLLTEECRQTNPKILAEFGPRDWCEREDRKRAIGLRSAVECWSLTQTELASTFSLPEAWIEMLHRGLQQHALGLADGLEKEPDMILPGVTLPSAVIKRDLRVRLLGAILKLMDGYPGLPARFVTIQHRGWVFEPGNLSAYSLGTRECVQFQEDMRWAGVTRSGGYLIAYHDWEFDPKRHSMRMYIRGIATGANTAKVAQARRVRP